MARRYEIGWAPPGGGWLVEALAREGVSQDLALRVGLFGQRGAEPPFAYFRGRIIFPIRNVAQRVAGFGGRLLGQGEPKYLNSPESAYFSKGKLLYGFASSRIAIARLKTAILVEGYLDLIALAQAGFANGVATCGTAFTADQARLLRRGCPTVFLLFDGDRAGLGATVKGCQTALAQGLEPRVARLPQGEDPASLLQTRDATALGEILSRASGYLPFLRELVEERGGTRVAKERAVRRALESIAQVPDPIRQAYLLQETAELFGIGLGILERESARLRGEARQTTARGGAAADAAGGASGTAAPGPPRPVAPAGPWLDRAAVEAVMFAHALRDDTGRAAGELLRLRAERACATPEGDLLRGEMLRWQTARAAGDEAPPGQFRAGGMARVQRRLPVLRCGSARGRSGPRARRFCQGRPRRPRAAGSGCRDGTTARRRRTLTNGGSRQGWTSSASRRSSTRSRGPPARGRATWSMTRSTR